MQTGQSYKCVQRISRKNLGVQRLKKKRIAERAELSAPGYLEPCSYQTSREDDFFGLVDKVLAYGMEGTQNESFLPLSLVPLAVQKSHLSAAKYQTSREDDRFGVVDKVLAYGTKSVHRTNPSFFLQIHHPAWQLEGDNHDHTLVMVRSITNSPSNASRISSVEEKLIINCRQLPAKLQQSMMQVEVISKQTLRSFVKQFL
ncbi:hypothetical protein TNCV_5094291 [Trichonephila clavipes]|nr:hypothetical protein TNCV_5094291 [Trichonephila clavipes]